MIWRRLPMGQIERMAYNTDGSLQYKIDMNGRKSVRAVFLHRRTKRLKC